MKVNFKRFKSPENVKDFLETKLILDVSKPDNVFAVLDDLGLRHSQIIDNSRWVHKVFDSSGDLEIKPSLYEQHITSVVQARPTLFIFRNLWMLYFHFSDGILAEIEVEKADVSY